MELSSASLAAAAMVPSLARHDGGLPPRGPRGLFAGRPLRRAVPGLAQPPAPVAAPAGGLALPGAAALVALAAAFRRRARAARATPRTVLADAPTATLNIQRVEEEHLLDELAEVRESNIRLRAQRELQEAENAARVGELAGHVAKSKERSKGLLVRLEEGQRRKAAMDEEAASLSAEGRRCAEEIRRQKIAIRHAVEVVETLRRKEAELTAQLAEYDRSSEETRKDMKSAEDLLAGYFSKRARGSLP